MTIGKSFLISVSFVALLTHEGMATPPGSPDRRSLHDDVTSVHAVSTRVLQEKDDSQQKENDQRSRMSKPSHAGYSIGTTGSVYDTALLDQTRRTREAAETMYQENVAAAKELFALAKRLGIEGIETFQPMQKALFEGAAEYAKYLRQYRRAVLKLIFERSQSAPAQAEEVAKTLTDAPQASRAEAHQSTSNREQQHADAQEMRRSSEEQLEEQLNERFAQLRRKLSTAMMDLNDALLRLRGRSGLLRIGRTMAEEAQSYVVTVADDISDLKAINGVLYGSRRTTKYGEMQRQNAKLEGRMSVKAESIQQKLQQHQDQVAESEKYNIQMAKLKMQLEALSQQASASGTDGIEATLRDLESQSVSLIQRLRSSLHGHQAVWEESSNATRRRAYSQPSSSSARGLMDAVHVPSAGSRASTIAQMATAAASSSSGDTGEHNNRDEN